MSSSALCPLDGRYAKQLGNLSVFFSETALMKARLAVEIHWLITLSQSNIAAIPALNANAEKNLLHLLEQFDDSAMERIKTIEIDTHHDVKAVEYYLRECLEDDEHLKHLSPWIHFAATSEDINNLAYSLMFQEALHKALLPQLKTLYQALKDLAHTYKDTPMLARTHGQSATPTTFGKEIAVFAWRLHKAIQPIATWQPSGKFSGAVGNFNAHMAAFPKADWCSLSAQLVQALGFSWQPLTTQIEPHDGLSTLCHHFIEAHTILLDLSRDVWHYISLHYLKQAKISQGQVGSSTMPHKINPIQFENAEGNLGLSNALLSHMAQKLPISRLQRDLSDSTVMRNVGTAFGYAHLAYQNLEKGLGLISTDGQMMQKDLDQHWEVLAEAAQSVLRALGQSDAYEALKASTQGKTMSEEDWHAWLNDANLDPETFDKLSALTPEGYTGLAAELVRFLPED